MANRLTREQILTIYNQGPDAVVAIIEMLQDRIEQLEQRVDHLEQIIRKDSHNSSKPPSSDGFKRMPRSLRGKSRRSSGGQAGHPGTTLCQVSNPDHVVEHRLQGNCGCGRSLDEAQRMGHERRQVVDLPPVKAEVTEHRAEIGRCACGQRHVAEFPEDVKAPVQYGERVKALVLYLIFYQLIPLKRTAELFGDFLGIPLSQGTLKTICHNAYESLHSTEAFIQERIRGSPSIHVDETGLYVGGKRHWLHSYGTRLFTYYCHHEKRGKEAMDAAGILPGYRGRATHDYWRPYYGFDCLHSLCNAHHLRELVFVAEELGQHWAQQMTALLRRIKTTVDRAVDRNRTQIHAATRKAYWERYQAILKEGYRVNPASSQQRKPGQRGRTKQSPARNLLDRFKHHAHEALAFMEDFSVAFDNNLAERDLRMMKVQQKISGCFRTQLGAKIFCRVRSFISTVKKQRLNVIEFLGECATVNNGQTILLPDPLNREPGTRNLGT